MHSEAIQYQHHIGGLIAQNKAVTTYIHKGREIKHRADGLYYVREISFTTLALAKLMIDLETNPQ